MKRHVSKICSMVMIAAISLTLFSGCTKQAEVKLPDTAKVETAPEEALLPVKNPLTLKYWASNSVPALVGNYADIAMYKELEKRTGVKVEFTHPPQGQEKEVFNMMIASRDIPDIIESVNTYYSGGLAKAFADEIIVDLKPLMDKQAPNLTKLYKTYPELNMEVETLEGRYFVVPWMKGSNAIRIQNGLIMRKDLLDELGLKVPANIKEFETVLQAFKEKKGIKIPFEINKADIKREAIAGAFGLEGNSGYLLENGKVAYWAYSPKCKDFITTMASWYKQGLIDPEFPVLTDKIKDARITSGEAAVYISTAGSGFLKYLEPGKKANPKFDLVGVPFPNPKFTQIDGFCSQNAGAVSITNANKNKDVTMAWMDYLFTKEGNLVANFGTEGESYKMENGYPKFADIITKDPKLSMGEVGRKYARSFGSGPFVQDKRYGEQFWALPQQKEALAAWSKHAEETVKDAHAVRGNLTPEESQSVASKTNDITTYVDEMYLKLVMGVEPLSKLDEFQAQLKKMGIEDILKLRQNAHDRFMKKFPEANNPRNVELSDFFMK